MNVNQMFQIMGYALAKNKQQGYFSPNDFYTVINQAQRSYLDYLMGEYQKYQIQRPVAVVEFGQNERVRQSLAPLVYGAILNPDTTTGIAPFPNDYEYVDTMWSLYNFGNIKFIQQDRLVAYLDSAIDPIETNPVYLIQHEGFHFYPENINTTKLSYIRTPPSIVWGSTKDSNNRDVYNPSTSQQPVWADTDCLQIIVRALLLCGVSMQLNTVLQYSNDVKNTGQ